MVTPKTSSEDGDGNEPSFSKTLARILDAIEIHAPWSFSIAGSRTQAGDPIWPAGPGGPMPLPNALQQQLYSRCFIQPLAERGVESPQNGVPRPEDDITAALHTANSGKDRWETGWRIHQSVAQGQWLVAKGGYTRWVWPGEFLSHAGPGMPPQPGSVVSLFSPSGSAQIQGGFYFAFGQTLLDVQDDSSEVIRFYFNIAPTAAPTLVALVTRALNELQTPFRLKCLSNQGSYPRTDAAVLYIHQRFFRPVAGELIDVRRRLGSFIGSDVPLFTKKLMNGIGLAQDPASGPNAGLSQNTGGAVAPSMPESFGTHRCRLLADAIFSAHTANAHEPGERLAVVIQGLARNGVDIRQPYLNAGAADVYFLPEMN